MLASVPTWTLSAGLTALVIFSIAFILERLTALNAEGKPLWRTLTATIASTTTPMAGIPELKHCQQALVKYMAIPSQPTLGSAHIAGSAELYPYMTDLCRVLDEQEIPHPEIDYYLEIVGTGIWSKFLGALWAVRHDIEQAKRVYQGDSRTRLDDEVD